MTRLALLFTLIAGWLLLGGGPAMAQEVTVSLGDGGSLTPRSIQIFLLITVLSLAPGIAIMLTCFPFIVTVLSILRQALGLQQSPPNMLIVSLALIYPWVCIWSKRLHDAGKSGWLFLVALVVWFVLLMIVNQIVTVMFGGESARMMAAAMETGNPDAIMQASEASSQATAVPSAILSALVSIGMIFGANAILKQDPEENRYGPVPGAEGAPEAMPAESPVETPEDPEQK